MKFIKKFVESAKIEKTQITQKDFNTLENIFLDLHDQDNLTVRQQIKTTDSELNLWAAKIGPQPVKNSTLNSYWPVVSVRFEFDVMKFITNGYSFAGEGTLLPPLGDGVHWPITQLGFNKNFVLNKNFIIRKESDISDLFDPKPTQPKRAGWSCSGSDSINLDAAEIFDFLNDKFELGNKLKDLLDRSKGIEYYGFNWRIDLNLSVDQYKNNVYIQLDARYLVTVENID